MSKKIIYITIFSISLLTFGIVATIIGILNVSNVIVEKEFHSEILDDDQTLIIYQPPGYDLLFQEKYPVLYLLDGEAYFLERKEDRKQKWSMQKPLNRLIKEGALEKMIVVGIYSTERRTDNYTPSFDEDIQEGGLLSDYARFIIEEVKPYIDRKYRTMPAAEHTGIAGSSLGGLASLIIGWNHTDVFSKVGALSPSLWWNNYEIKQMALENTGEERSGMVWMDIGRDQDQLDVSIPESELLEQAEEVKQLFIAQGHYIERDIQVLPIEEKDDAEEELDLRLEKMLRFLYSS